MRNPGRTAALALAVTMTIGTGAQAAAAPPASADVPNSLPTAKLTVQTAKSATVKRTTANLRLRERASTSSATLLVIPKGTKLSVLATSNGWNKIKYGGKTGWSAGSYLEKTSSTTDSKGGSVRYTTANLNLRTGAGTGYRSLGVIPQGEKVTVSQTSKGWAKVSSSKGTGWSSASYLTSKGSSSKPSNPKTDSPEGSRYTTANLNLRTGAGTGYRSLGVIPEGEKVNVLRTSGNWAQVSSSKGTGWVSRTYLGGGASNTEPKTPPTAKKSAYTTANLNVRSGAGTSHRSLGVIPKGEKVTIHTTSSGWSQVSSSQGTGWASSAYLSTSAKSDSQPKGEDKDDSVRPIGGSTQWTTANLNLRSGAGTSHRSLGVIPKGEKLTVHLTTAGWSKVTASEGTGYVSADYLSDEKPSSAQYRWTTGSLHLRTGPGTSYASKGILPAYGRVQLISAQNGWAKVTSSVGTGYVSSRYLSTAELHPVRSDTQVVIKQLRQLFAGDFTSLGTVRPGSVGHSSGKAVDAMIGNYRSAAGIAAGDRISQFLLDNRKQLGVHYLIWQDKIWLSEAKGWEPYSTSGKYGTQFTDNWNDTTRHMDHVHVETYGDSATGGALDYSALNG
ncbi:SH3 domain-containing protein [Glutamicibacter sp. AOP33-2CA-4]|uniref:SH3 domain-containing protein n=1 Tax=Glutamicibacter sp. AOP33-2CA-4 TaxID=3457690 RepID=UPI004033F63F